MTKFNKIREKAPFQQDFDVVYRVPMKGGNLDFGQTFSETKKELWEKECLENLIGI